MVIRGKFIEIRAYVNIKEKDRSQVNNIIVHLKDLVKEGQTKPKCMEERK